MTSMTSITPMTAEILKPETIERAITALKDGDVVGIPTETVYGLAGNAFNADAVARIFAVKDRPSFDPLIVHVAPEHCSLEGLHGIGVINLNKLQPRQIEVISRLLKRFCPGPLTLLLPKSDQVPDLVTSGLDLVGVRFPKHPVAQRILSATGLALAAPSANRFGRISPTTAEHVREELGERISYIIDGGPCEVGVESTVIAVDQDRIWLLRPGKITAAELHEASGMDVSRASSVHEKASPGMLASHYAPAKPLVMVSDWGSPLPGAIDSPRARIGVLITVGPGTTEMAALAKSGLNVAASHILSPDENPETVAKNLFAALRTLDHADIDVILTNQIHKTDALWAAILDRVTRATIKNSI
jgi:L-threonylcarbamoyladenylate synthase